MGIPQLNSCCCGCSLKTGTKIIGWYSLIGSIIATVFLGIGLAGLYYIEEHPEAGGKDAAAIREHIGILKALSIFLLIISLVDFVLSFILLHGIYQGKANLILIWVILSLICTIIGMAGSLSQFFTPFPPNVIICVISYLFPLYYYLVVYSFYREIRNVSTNYA